MSVWRNVKRDIEEFEDGILKINLTEAEGCAAYHRATNIAVHRRRLIRRTEEVISE